ncbi:mitochondrial intermembrane space import and assembly protein 40-like protein [Dinothrombium tinctorium]|uniref:Mitochondrial intermembrane space import and assembly protein 40-like protein n=1 Tax=Dinothrombium tinctorium TaxID=1965070 RepID=A0A3S3SR71_9ACAR|nr:mitochondrial intermembrane space import and assembly protein 40-like protein [Dinothrombium tinctorium]RWS17931.1 mitochondrial intermembrane space import and assembly protein 40-like protein [Dinothrombium tinctorium]
MSFCTQKGKDRIIFATKEDHNTPSTVQLPQDDNEPRGLILPNGEINWNCPCLGGMASGPCGFQFREAFSCFHKSTSESKGSDCIEKFVAMHECMSKYPNLYPHQDDGDDEEGEDDALDFQKIVEDDKKSNIDPESHQLQASFNENQSENEANVNKS